MSYARTVTQQWLDELAVTSGGGPAAWTLGAAVEAFASVAANTRLLDFGMKFPVGSLQLDGQVAVQIGLAGYEVAIGSRRFQFGQSAGDSWVNTPFRTPLALVAGDRVTLAAETSVTAHYTFGISVGYTEGDGSDFNTTWTYRGIPERQNSVNLVSPSTPWTYSDWVPLSAGIESDDYLTGCLVTPVSLITAPYQVQIGSGADPNASILTTFKGNAGNNGAIGQAQSPSQGHSFPRPYPVTEGTALWARLACSGSSAANWRIALETLTGDFVVPPPPPPVGSLTILKVVTDPASDTTTLFNMQVFGGVTPDTFSLANGQSQNYSSVTPGIYSIVETLPSAIWEQVSAVVSNGSPVTAITVADGEFVLVTFTNRQIPAVPLTEDVVDRRLRRAPHLNFEQLWRFYNYIQFDVEAGVGVTTGQGSVPVLQVRWSDDGGHTWSNIRQVPLGKKGQYAKRAITRLLGRSRDRVFEVVVSDPVKAVLLAAYINYEQGVH